MPEETKKKVPGFLIACKKYFGYLEGQTLKSFADEMKGVDIRFRKEIYDYFKSVGIESEAPLFNK